MSKRTWQAGDILRHESEIYMLIILNDDLACLRLVSRDNPTPFYTSGGWHKDPKSVWLCNINSSFLEMQELANKEAL